MAPVDLTNHYQNPYLRPLPHYRTYFRALLCSCNPFVRSFTLSPRRLVFLLVFLMRTVQTSYYLLLAALGLGRNNSIWVLVFIFLVVSTVELWNLHLIVEAEGDGAVLGWRIPAVAFSVVLFWITVWHMWMVPMEMNGMAFYVSGKATLIMEVFWIAVICCLAWVANQDWEGVGVILA